MLVQYQFEYRVVNYCVSNFESWSAHGQVSAISNDLRGAEWQEKTLAPSSSHARICKVLHMRR